MNQILEEIKKSFPNKEEYINSYDTLSKDLGLIKAIGQLEKSKKGIQTATSDFVYIAYTIDIEISKTLIALYTYLISNNKPITPLHINENLSTKEKISALKEWQDKILKKT